MSYRTQSGRKLTNILDTIAFSNMAILFDTNERSKLRVVLISSSLNVILDSSGNDRQNCMSVLMQKSWYNKGSIFYLGIIQSVYYAEGFLEDYHATINKIPFLNKRRNKPTDQAPTINDQVKTYLMQYMREHELGYVQRISYNIDTSMLEDVVKCVISILWFSQRHRHTLQIHCKKSYNNHLMDLYQGVYHNF